jgi:epoxide hydrolase-like predicted phosphatase
VARLRGVITDWGGVLTNPLIETVNAWLVSDGIDQESYYTIMRQWVQQAYTQGEDGNPIHLLERGECPVEEFELALASNLALLDGGPVASAGLVGRMFAATKLNSAMLDVFRKLHTGGVPTGLLSNSWGVADYPRELFPGVFDAVVISGEVGMRKPEPRIFLHTAQLLALAPAECVFVDDIQANVTAAEQVGFTGVLHTEPAATTSRLGELLAIELP